MSEQFRCEPVAAAAASEDLSLTSFEPILQPKAKAINAFASLSTPAARAAVASNVTYGMCNMLSEWICSDEAWVEGVWRMYKDTKGYFIFPFKG